MIYIVGGNGIEGQILDIGCGGGANLQRLMQRSLKGKVTGVDYSSVSVEKSKKVNADAIDKGRCNVLEAGSIKRFPKFAQLLAHGSIQDTGVLESKLIVEGFTYKIGFFSQNIAISRGNLLKIDTFPRVIGASSRSSEGTVLYYGHRSKENKNRRPDDLLLNPPQDYVAELLLERGPRGRGLLRDSITHPYHGVTVSLQS